MPDFRTFQELFSNELLLKILGFLYQAENKTSNPAEIAKILDIHKSTAKKYLELLEKNGIVTSKILRNRPGTPTMYFLSKEKLIIVLDFANLGSSVENEYKSKNLVANPRIREKYRPQSQNNYLINENGLVESITYIIQTKAGHNLRKSIILSPLEQEFMKFLPHPTMDYDLFLNICSNAGINSHFKIKNLSLFTSKLIALKIVERSNDKET